MLLLRGLLVITYLGSAVSIFSCLDKPCSCCKRGKCEDLSLHRYPCDGCITGFTGPSCLEQCPTNCENCSQLFFEYDTEKVCFQCKVGFYNGQYRDIEIYPFQKDCALACKTGCELCTSYNDCSKCKIGYLLSEGKECKECPPYCKHCLSEFSCLACQDGYAWSGVVCQPCKPSCKRCKFSGECIECDGGFYERDNDCARCPLGCAYCSWPDICNDCQEGNYLVQGQCFECRDNCKACSLNSMSQYTCRACRKGFFLSDNICLECEIGCISCRSKSDCLICLSSYQLNDGKCYSCSPRCTSCSTLNKCTACESNYYLMDDSCYSCQKNCAICSNDKLCTTCQQGYFGTDCSHVCPSNCANYTCNQSTGKCIACKNGYYFDQSSCIKCPSHCSVCTSNSTCLSCASGYMGITCEKKCVCRPGTACDKSTGYCFEACADGLSGKSCNLPCDSNCMSCDRGNPSKCAKCALDRYGSACLSKCSEKCGNNTCDDIDGVCTYSCITGAWGSRCEHRCSENCKSKMCERSNGKCFAGCIDNITGVNGINCSIGPETNASKGTINAGVITGIVTFLLVFSALVLFLIKFRKRIKSFIDRETSTRRRNTRPEEEDLLPTEQKHISKSGGDLKEEINGWKKPSHKSKTVNTFVRQYVKKIKVKATENAISRDTYKRNVEPVNKTEQQCEVVGKPSGQPQSDENETGAGDLNSQPESSSQSHSSLYETGEESKDTQSEASIQSQSSQYETGKEDTDTQSESSCPNKSKSVENAEPISQGQLVKHRTDEVYDSQPKGFSTD